jgi:acetate kinase
VVPFLLALFAMNILVLNAGSSTLKFRLLALRDAADEEPRVLVDGMVDKWGTPQAGLKVSVAGEKSTRESVAAESPAEAAEHAIRVCQPHGIDAIGHRVVHGGPRFVQPARITVEVVQAIRAVSSLAPLHNANALQGIEAGLALLPNAPAGAVFDTAFHATIPDVAARYAIPYDLAEKHALRRYGFHGISHRYVSERLLRCLGRNAPGTRLITCHLGNGASVCAIRDGQSVDTSMGLTPMEGLIMGTRSGDVDPGLVLHLITALKMSATDVDNLLNHRSGSLGLSGRSADMREIEQAAATGDRRAEGALASFAYRVRKYIGAYAACLGGLDAIAFTAGIGEHSSEMRDRICHGLEWLGVQADAARNRSATGAAPARVSTDAAAVQAWVVPTDEEGEIARELHDLLR